MLTKTVKSNLQIEQSREVQFRQLKRMFSHDHMGKKYLGILTYQRITKSKTNQPKVPTSTNKNLTIEKILQYMEVCLLLTKGKGT